MTRSAFLLLVSIFAWNSGSVIRQSAFRAGVETVAIYVTVVGDGNRLVSNLTAADFEIRDDGKRRMITQFEAGSLPITLVAMLDDSPSMQPAQPRVAAAALVQRLRADDRATIGFFNRTVTIEGNLVSDHDELLKRLTVPPTPMAGTALWDGVSAGMSALELESGRRVVLILTDGDDNSSEIDAPTIKSRAIREGVMVYVIGMRGGERRLNKTLAALARETGGSFLELKASDHLPSTFQRVADELHSQYLLGFSIETLDGEAHRLEVKVKRPGLTVRARTSYVASKAVMLP